MKFTIHLKYQPNFHVFIILSSPLHYYEGFFSFLYLLSIFFLFYVFCCEYSFVPFENTAGIVTQPHNNQPNHRYLLLPGFIDCLPLQTCCMNPHAAEDPPNPPLISRFFIFFLYQSEIMVNNIWPHFESEINVCGLYGLVWLERDFFF